MYRDLEHLISLWISIFQNLRLEHLMKAYVRNQLITSAAIYLAFFCCLSFLWLDVSSLVDPLQVPWTQIRIPGGAYYVKAAVHIIIGYAILLTVNTRYISLFILPIIMLVFIGALFTIVSMKSRLSLDLKWNQDSNDEGLFLIAVLTSWLLSCTGYFEADTMVVSQFLLFLSSSLGELTLMLARLPSEVAPAFEVVHGASLVAVLLTSHTMAAELLGADAVLVCMPELVAALAWLAIHLAHGGATAVHAVEAALREADIVVLGVVAPILTYLVPICRDEPKNPLSTSSYIYIPASVACAFSVILPSLCVFALRQWRGRQTTAAPSAELEGAIRLLSFCRDTMLKAVAMFLFAKLLTDERLRSTLATDILWRKFL